MAFKTGGNAGISLMEWLDSVLVSGTDIYDDASAKDYKPFVVNRGVAQNIDTVMYAQAMNKLPMLSPEMQYRFLLHGINKKKRYGKWAKKTTDDTETLEMVAVYYQVNLERAAEYLKLLKPEQLDEIKRLTDKGGRGK